MENVVALALGSYHTSVRLPALLALGMPVPGDDGPRPKLPIAAGV